ncbi:PAN2-PAN3 deadenylation complex catalytic subunit PAN2 [Anoplophora glabripennis]|nr:PAN2-PAN3 deadenylation complex catalytic subunit PAN2 [Anoplophora glabripennis]
MYFDNTGLAVVAPPENSGLMGIDAEYVQTNYILADGAHRFGVSALTFDKVEELLWMGNQGGHITSYYLTGNGGMDRYTSFQIHANEDVRQILCIDDGILALTSSTLRYQMRRGIPIYTHTSVNMNEMHCMLQLTSSRILLGGQQDKLIDYNLDLCKETMLVEAGEAGCVMLRPHSRFICAGNPLGHIDFRDPNTLNTEHSIDTHTGSLSDFDVQGNLLVTCGFSNRHNSLTVDRFLMVYDLRMMRAVSPMQTVLDPFFLKFIPSISSRLAVVSAIGQVQLLDTIALAEPRLCLLQMNNPGALCLTFDISSNSQAMAFGDSSGHIHFFATSDHPTFNTFSRSIEFAESVARVHQYPSFSIEDANYPLSVVPMPVVPPEVPLASDWPPHFMEKVYRKPPAIDPEILHTMKMQGPIGYAPNPKTSRRNQVIYDFTRNGHRVHSNRTVKSPKRQEESNSFIAIPKRYRKIDVRYSKLGSDEFQFDHYNKTSFSGLEATLPNSYCNAMIQVLYFTEPLRAALLSHLCSKEFCLSCELGFLFHMLGNPYQNQPCQPGNFLRAFRTVPEASALGLILSDLHPEAKLKIDLSALIQSWNRFMLHQMHVELVETKKRHDERRANKKPFIYKEIDFPSISGDRSRERRVASDRPEVVDVDTKLENEKREDYSEISQLFGTKQLQMNCCLKCSCEVRKESLLLACNLVYPTSEPEREEWSFCDILKRSLCPQQTTPAWCERCSRFTPTAQSRILQSLPKLLAINTGLHNFQHKQFWQTQMDKMVAKATKLALDINSSPSMASSITSSKPCRYGDNCSRPGCRFRHSFDNNPPTVPTNNLYCSNNWLPHEIEMALRDESLKVRKLEDKEKQGERNVSVETKKYELSSVVCYINDQSSPDRRNLVALIKVPDPYLQSRDKADHKWYLFNDFSISPVPAQEAVWFSLDWKVPCVLYYSSPEILDANSAVRHPMSREVFTEDACIARSGGTRGITFTPLSENEILKSGDLVAMDAEFVTLNQEEAELRSDGKMSTIKPSQMSVARITCIRGHGHMEGTPFIDDYISTQEQVVDYLTKFSGIKPGDLDANFSSKHLTTLKSTYTKLRFLQDSGVIFVGHGLKNDFRVINLVVPPEQVADTVQLFHLPHHRMVSLRFLAWHFLGIKIQSETHDSVEDARAALQLYKKYKQLEAQSKVGDALAELYETGKLLNWKVPED